MTPSHLTAADIGSLSAVTAVIAFTPARPLVVYIAAVASLTSVLAVRSSRSAQPGFSFGANVSEPRAAQSLVVTEPGAILFAARA
jgi:hypothetical protein